MSANAVGFTLLILGVALLLGKFVRVKVGWLQSLFLPSSIIGGAILLLLGPQVLGRFDGPWGENGLFRSDEYYPAGTMTSRPSSVEPFSLHMSIAAVAGGVHHPGGGRHRVQRGHFPVVGTPHHRSLLVRARYR
ncbi:hypothetical protein M3B14_04620 [Kocuria marina]|uniref:hypothetical protein n=1 Tax=Kocuria marina TaxID=223184 RepID=UPI002989B55D|nr:hypothetical protein [Kocuria marina]MCT1722913.1 hypothetical protein [Kocuria marina]MCT1734269.1 hypothetical protein [Kocuria marina]